MSQACWASENEDDLVVLRNEVSQGNRLFGWFKFMLDVLRWELWGNKRVGLRVFSVAWMDYLADLANRSRAGHSNN